MLDGVVRHVTYDATDKQTDASSDRKPDTNATLSYRALVALNASQLEARGLRYKITPGMQLAAEIHHDYREPEEKRGSPKRCEKQAKKIERGLGAMERELGDREFCYGGRFSLADIAAGYAAVGYLDRVWRRIDWRTPPPNLKRLADRLATRDSFRLTLPPPA